MILDLKSEIFVTKTYQITQPKAMVIGFDTFKSWGRREEILIDKSLRKRGFSLDLKHGFMEKFVWVRCQQWRQQGLFKKSGKAFRLKAFHHQPIPTTPPHLV